MLAVPTARPCDCGTLQAMASAAEELAEIEGRAEQLEDEAMQHERDQQPIAAQAKLQKAKALRDKVLAIRQGLYDVLERSWGVSWYHSSTSCRMSGVCACMPVS